MDQPMNQVTAPEPLVPAAKAGWAELGPIDLIPRGQGRCFSIGESRIAVFVQRDGGIFALDAACPHRAGPLADGIVGAGMVVCPLHAFRFRLTDGAGVDNEFAVTSYPIDVRDGAIFVRIAKR